MPYKRTDRINALLHRALGQLISEELTDPRIAFVTVTAVETAPDLRTARVHVSVLGTAEEGRDTMRALEGARQHLRKVVGERIDLRYVPALIFVEDHTAEQAARISSLLREAREGQGGAGADDGEEPQG